MKISTKDILNWQPEVNDDVLKQLLGELPTQLMDGCVSQNEETVEEDNQSTLVKIPNSECSVCQDVLLEESSTYCSSCGNNFHIECIQKWMLHRVSSDQHMSCPLCRNDWRAVGGTDMKAIGNAVTHEGVVCNDCQVSPVVGILHKCIVCPNICLCDSCQQKGSHAMHNTIRHKGSQWQPEDTKDLGFLSVEQSEQAVLWDELNADDQKKVMCNQIAECITQMNGVKPNDVCVRCTREGNMTVLNCGHWLHSQCLATSVDTGCPRCADIIAYGYYETLTIQNETTENKSMFNAKDDKTKKYSSKAKNSIDISKLSDDLKYKKALYDYQNLLDKELADKKRAEVIC